MAGCTWQQHNTLKHSAGKLLSTDCTSAEGAPQGTAGDFQAWRMRWQAGLVPTIPLYPGSKQAIHEAWQVVPPGEQWQRAGKDCNIGVLLGNGLAVLDTDTAATTRRVINWLQGLGLLDRLAQVATPHEGRAHFYLAVRDVPPGTGAFRHLAPAVGAGELRIKNCYVAAPCSVFGGTQYRFISGSPESIKTQPVIRWRDLAWLVAPEQPVLFEFEQPPVRLVRRDAPALAGELIVALRNAPAGIQVGRYSSRSEAEAALVTVLILAGWEYSEIAALFEREQPGHYRDKKQGRFRYLALTYRNALKQVANTPERLQVAELYHQLERAAWVGRGGGLERGVTLGLLAHAWQFSAWDTHASNRAIEEHAAASHRGVQNALKRLQAAGLIRRLDTEHAELSTHYDLSALRGVSCISSHKSQFLVLTGSMGDLPGSNAGTTTAHSEGIGQPVKQTAGMGDTWGTAELWSNTRLTRSAGAVYVLLCEQPASVGELAATTGKHPVTVRRALRSLAEFGLAVGSGSGWVRGKGKLEEVAYELQTKQAAEHRRRRHDWEREVQQERRRMHMRSRINRE